MTLTEILLTAALLVSFIATVLHTTLPAIICSLIHIGVTGITSAIHLKQVRTKAL